MKLYDVPKGSYVRVSPIQEEEFKDSPQSKGRASEVSTPIDSPKIKSGQLIYFDHIDGMYSLCYNVDESTMKHGDICHMAGWTEVEIIDPLKDTPFKLIRELIGRAGYGKDGNGEYREASLCEMSDDWVKASINFVGEGHPHRKYYIEELKYRIDNDIIIVDTKE